jgi:hypothetical protein
LSLPIETIHEDVMEDPEQFLQDLNEQANLKDDEERQKILSVIKEMKEKQRKESSNHLKYSVSNLSIPSR